MHRYLAHLLADLETAIRNAPVASSYSSFSTPFEEEELESYLFLTRLLRLCDLFEISPDAFPPIDRLNKSQVSDLLFAFEKLWRAWRIEWTCPPRLTARRRYVVMTEVMRHEIIPYHPDRGARIDFCEAQSLGGCPFGEGNSCWCEEIEASKNDINGWEASQTSQSERPASPVEEFYNWLQHEDGSMEHYPWEEDDPDHLYRNFLIAEDPNAWLFFFRPDIGSKLSGEAEDDAVEDFDDFDWDDHPRRSKSSEDDPDFGLPF